MLPAVRAIVFDLDGTLVDSLADIIAHINAALGDHGLPERDPDAITSWVGHGADELVRHAVAREDLVAPVLATFRTRYRARPVIESRVYAGLPDVLDALAPRYRLAVLSNKPHDITVDVCAALLGRWPFAVIAGARPNRPRKPDPQALVDVARELAIDVTACALVGDSEVDIATARSASAPSIAVAWGMRPLATLTAAQPDHLVHAPRDLASLFGL
jgi:phosphoglycolate phosphatase